MYNFHNTSLMKKTTRIVYNETFFIVIIVRCREDIWNSFVYCYQYLDIQIEILHLWKIASDKDVAAVCYIAT